jgi:hypothetical protein
LPIASHFGQFLTIEDTPRKSEFQHVNMRVLPAFCHVLSDTRAGGSVELCDLRSPARGEEHVARSPGATVIFPSCSGPDNSSQYGAVSG